jgi:hypothetical protein
MICSRPTRLVKIFNSASSLNQHSADGHVTPLGHIILWMNMSLHSDTLFCGWTCHSTQTHYSVDEHVTPLGHIILWMNMSLHSDTLFCGWTCHSTQTHYSVDGHVTPLRHIILIQSQPVFALFSYWYVLSGEAENNNFIVICLTRPGLKPTIYYTLGENASHYTSL